MSDLPPGRRLPTGEELGATWTAWWIVREAIDEAFDVKGLPLEQRQLLANFHSLVDHFCDEYTEATGRVFTLPDDPE